jgi:hypothetical protein
VSRGCVDGAVDRHPRRRPLPQLRPPPGALPLGEDANRINRLLGQPANDASPDAERGIHSNDLGAKPGPVEPEGVSSSIHVLLANPVLVGSEEVNTWANSKGPASRLEHDPVQGDCLRFPS